MTDLSLRGCTPEPIGSYLKALGVLRLVAGQADPEARGWWRGDDFGLRSRLDDNALVAFFLHEYRPTPVIAPWNGGSGFFAKDNKRGIEAIEKDSTPRFAPYRDAIHRAREVLAALGIGDAMDAYLKPALLMRLRDEMDEPFLAWMDAALSLTTEGPRYPALLGTGGNDGRLDFTNNQMQRLAELLIDAPASSEALLRSSLFGSAVPGLAPTAIGQYSPAAAGGANSGTGFEGRTRVNPWDYVLLLEGVPLFASRITRRLEGTHAGGLSFPFAVQASGSGYGTAATSDAESARSEQWLPLWDVPAGLAEVRALFGEGRVQVGRRTARTGVDFARAVRSLSADRGIVAFVRYGFHRRNGLAYFATPLDRWDVGYSSTAELLQQPELDGWLERLARAAADSRAPARIRAAQRRIEDAILRACRSDSPASVQDVLIALGEAERALAVSLRFTTERGIRPVPRLSSQWVRLATDDSVEFRLAVAAASLDLRRHRVPVVTGRYPRWAVPGPEQVWGAGSLVTSLLAVLRRREATEDASLPQGQWFARLGDIGRFIDGRVDDDRLEQLVAGFGCCELRSAGPTPGPAARLPFPPALYLLVKTAFDRVSDGPEILKQTPGMLARAASGDAAGASLLAIRRLRAAGLIPDMQALHEAPGRTRRIAAALLFPVSQRAHARMLDRISAYLTATNH